MCTCPEYLNDMQDLCQDCQKEYNQDEEPTQDDLWEEFQAWKKQLEDFPQYDDPEDGDLDDDFSENDEDDVFPEDDEDWDDDNSTFNGGDQSPMDVDSD